MLIMKNNSSTEIRMPGTLSVFISLYKYPQPSSFHMDSIQLKYFLDCEELGGRGGQQPNNC